MIKPVNQHLLIKPVAHKTFIATQTETYEEIGEVLALADGINHVDMGMTGVTSVTRNYVNVGDKVYFDAWLAAKFPGEKEGDHYWLVKWEHIRAVENVD